MRVEESRGSFWSFRNTSALLSVCLLLMAARAASALTRIVVIGARTGASADGDPAPDGDGVFLAFGVPALNDAGQVAFLASFTGGSGGTGMVRADSSPERLVLIAREDDPAPDGNGNIGHFIVGPNDPPPGIDASGQIVAATKFVGTFGGTRDSDGLLSGYGEPQNLTIVARSGGMLSGGTILAGPIDPPTVARDGRIVFNTFIVLPPSGGDRGIFSSEDGTTTAIVHDDQPAPDGNGVFALFGTGGAANDLGQVAFFSKFKNAQNGANAGYVLADAGTLTQIVRSGDPVPGGNGTFEFLRDSVNIVHSADLNNRGEMAFFAKLAGVSGIGTDGIFRGGAGEVVAIVRRGDLAPDGNGRFLNLEIEDVSLNDDGQVAFYSSLTSTSGGDSDNSGVFVGDGDELVQIVRRGQATPDGSGTFVEGPLLDHQPVINNRGQVAFQFAVSDGRTVGKGLFLWDPETGIREVAREGSSLGCGVASPVSRVFFYASTPAFGKQRSGLNDQGQVAFEFFLQSGNTGIALWSAGGEEATCVGDCSGDCAVSINELIRAVQISLGLASIDSCRAADRDGDGTVSISELIVAVKNALNGCPAS